MTTSVDFAATLINPDAIKAAGHDAVMVYVSPSRPGSNFGAKPITKAYTDQLKAAGLEVVSIWQYGKPGNAQTPSDWTTGFDGGVRMAREANERHRAAGGPLDAPIYFAVDEDITLTQWNTGAVEFFKGLTWVLGVDRTGIYGHSRVCDWAREDGLATWFWQTRAWSNGVILTSYGHLYQRVIDTPTNPGPKIDGSSVDVNDILRPEYGQWSKFEQTEQRPPVKPEYTEINRIGNSSSNRFGSRITNFLFHTQEGNGTAESLAAYLNNSANGVSYHYTIRGGVVVDVVDTDEASWSVLDANPFTINACLAGSRASWSREQWLEIEDDIRIACWLAVEDAKRYGFSTEVIVPPYHQADGISDHKYVTQELGIGSHTDVGPNFPWDKVQQFVGEYANGWPVATVPQGNAINDCEAANAWLGGRFTKEELPTPDGVGRYVQYDNGFIYWSPSSGAHPIPKELFPKFSEMSWEVGPLGYPTTDPTRLTGVSGEGWVQGFQGGAIYRKDGQPGYVLWGEIRKRWNETGFENGPLGWPASDETTLADGVAQTFEHGRILFPTKSTMIVGS